MTRVAPVARVARNPHVERILSYVLRAGAGVALVAGTGLVLDAGPAVAAGPSCSAGICTVTFSETGSTQTFTVPAEITSITVTADGAQGGGGDVSGHVKYGGGLGGEVTSSLSVTPGDVLSVVVGQRGTDADGFPPNAVAGGYGGGGTGAAGGGQRASGGGGGGGSFLFGPSGDLLVAAGGGGGAGGAAGEVVETDGVGGSGGNPGTQGGP